MVADCAECCADGPLAVDAGGQFGGAGQRFLFRGSGRKALTRSGVAVRESLPARWRAQPPPRVERKREKRARV